MVRGEWHFTFLQSISPKLVSMPFLFLLFRSTPSLGLEPFFDKLECLSLKSRFLILAQYQKLDCAPPNTTWSITLGNMWHTYIHKSFVHVEGSTLRCFALTKTTGERLFFSNSCWILALDKPYLSRWLTSKRNRTNNRRRWGWGGR